jgi:DNA-binding SARP family transcriptional activator/tetratricopeptide (TPR) repeat protein/class 3 adenylate cyclase
MQRLELAFLGPPRIKVDGKPLRVDTRKAIALLAYLSVTGEPQSRDSLVALLWSRYGRTQGHAALRRTLSTLRTGLPPDRFRTERDMVTLNPSSGVWIDVSRVRNLLGQCDSHGHGVLGACPACIPLLSEAARLHRGDFLAGFTLKDSLPFDDWQFFLTEDFRLQRAKILDKLSFCHAASGDYSAAIGTARMRLSQDSLDESAHATLMRLHAWAGNWSAAIRQFDECSRILRQELGSPPRRSTEELCEAIREGRLPRPPSFDTPSAARERSPGSAPPSSPQRLEQETQQESAMPHVATVLALRATKKTGQTEAFRRAVTDGIERYHGAIVEGSGPGPSAVFADRKAMESNPELAIRAALEIETVAKARGVELSIGVSSGQVWRDPGLPLSHPDPPHASGCPMTRATQLAGNSRPGSVVTDELTYRLTRDSFSFEMIAENRSAARRTPLAYRVLGIAQDARKTRGIEGARPALIGREEEVRRLEAAYEKSASGIGQVVIITGDAGIGKSRLVEELRMRVTEARKGGRLTWLEGRCLASSMAIGYWPFVDMLRALCAARIAKAGGDRNPIDELARDLTRKDILSEEERRKLTPIVTNLVSASSDGNTLDPGLTPEQVKHATFLAILSFLGALTKTASSVLVFEDLHWADDLSLQLIDALLDSLRGAPALLVCVYRPDPGHKSRHLSSTAARLRQADLTEIHLREITMEDGELLLRSLAPGGALPAAMREYILRRSQGNPYFLEELVRACAGGESPLEDGEESANGSIPEGIKRVVLSRYYGLPPLHRQVLSCAAVIGRVFQKRLLGLAMNRGDLSPVLDDLEDRELLFVERTVPEVEYSFRHVLAQEAVYENLAEPERIGLHRQVVDSYERLASGSSDEYCERLAFHCDRGNLPAKAIAFYYRSGEKARRAYANEAAIFHLSRGLELLRGAKENATAPVPELDFLIAVGVPLVLTKGHPSPEVEAVYLRAKSICEQTGNEEQLFQAVLGLRRLYFARGEHRKERELAQQMLELGQRGRDAALTSRAHMMLSETLVAQGDFAGALEHARGGCHLYDPRDSRRHLVQFGNDTGVGCFVSMALAQWNLGLPDQALRTIELAVARARELAHPFTLVFALHHAAVVAYFRREAEKALQWSAEVISVSGQEGFMLYKSWGPILQGWAVGMLGEVDRGIDMIREGLNTSPPFVPFRPLFASMLAEVCQMQGRTADAVSALDEGFSVVRSSDAHLWEPELNRQRAEVGLATGESEIDAERWLVRALRVARKQRAKSLELRALTSLCRRRAAGGNCEEMRGQLASLHQSFSEGLGTRDLEDARRLLEQLAP